MRDAAADERERIKEIVEAHADMDERGNRVLVDLIVDEIDGGSEVRTPKAHTHILSEEMS